MCTDTRNAFSSVPTSVFAAADKSSLSKGIAVIRAAPAARQSITSSRSRGSSLEFLARAPRRPWFRVMVRSVRHLYTSISATRLDIDERKIKIHLKHSVDYAYEETLDKLLFFWIPSVAIIGCIDFTVTFFCLSLNIFSNRCSVPDWSDLYILYHYNPSNKT